MRVRMPWALLLLRLLPAVGFGAAWAFALRAVLGLFAGLVFLRTFGLDDLPAEWQSVWQLVDWLIVVLSLGVGTLMGWVSWKLSEQPVESPRLHEG